MRKAPSEAACPVTECSPQIDASHNHQGFFQLTLPGKSAVCFKRLCHLPRASRHSFQSRLIAGQPFQILPCALSCAVTRLTSALRLHQYPAPAVLSSKIRQCLQNASISLCRRFPPPSCRFLLLPGLGSARAAAAGEANVAQGVQPDAAFLTLNGRFQLLLVRHVLLSVRYLRMFQGTTRQDRAFPPPPTGPPSPITALRYRFCASVRRSCFLPSLASFSWAR